MKIEFWVAVGSESKNEILELPDSSTGEEIAETYDQWLGDNADTGWNILEDYRGKIC